MSYINLFMFYIYYGMNCRKKAMNAKRRSTCYGGQLLQHASQPVCNNQ